MSLKLKPLNEQVVVLTGASSGIGLATARAAAARGAKLVLAARSEQTLQNIAQELIARNSETIAVSCDVADRQQVGRVAEAAIQRFGRIDTWVNDAGVAIYGRLDEVSDEDSRRLMETNFWGVVYGSLAALPHLKRSGGALINIGSEVSDAYVPLLGMYVASKHAVKGFTDSLRLEIERVDEAPVSITLIQPTAVNTPFPQHARNYQGQEAKLPDPMIDPDQVAEAILHAAENPTRDKRVGKNAVINSIASKVMTSVADRMAAKQVDKQHYDMPPRNPAGALHQSSEVAGFAGRTHGPSEAEHASTG